MLYQLIQPLYWKYVRYFCHCSCPVYSIFKHLLIFWCRRCIPGGQLFSYRFHFIRTAFSNTTFRSLFYREQPEIRTLSMTWMWKLAFKRETFPNIIHKLRVQPLLNAELVKPHFLLLQEAPTGGDWMLCGTYDGLHTGGREGIWRHWLRVLRRRITVWSS